MFTNTLTILQEARKQRKQTSRKKEKIFLNRGQREKFQGKSHIEKLKKEIYNKKTEIKLNLCQKLEFSFR